MSGDGITGEDLELFERSLAHATASASGAALDAELDALGWADALALDPQAAIDTLFTLQGANNSTSGALDRVIIDALFGPEDGEVGHAIVLPRLGTGTPPAVLLGEQLRVDGLATGALSSSDSVVVVAVVDSHDEVEDGESVAVTVEKAPLYIEPVRGMDSTLGLSRVHGDLVLPAGSVIAPVPWDAALARGRLALSHELVGASRTMLELARTHALERIQFGVPISSFQAVRHRLAEALVAIEAAAASCDGAWSDATPFTAMVAKATAGRSTRIVARHTQQVLAGVGFTAEHALHYHVKRALVLDQFLGDTKALTRGVGATLMAADAVPDLLPL
jgi:hypothetical protein